MGANHRNRQQTEADDANPALVAEISRCIAEAPEGRIGFDTFMEMVLYHPEYGYYAAHSGRIGAGGDYYTSIHLGSVFAETLAVQFVQMWQLLGEPERFRLVEAGAGQGLFAADLLRTVRRHHPSFAAALEYVIVERSPAQVSEQKRRLQGYDGVLLWTTLEAIEPASLVGCIFSNELLDALPVHRFAIVGGQLQEIFVRIDEAGRFEAVPGSPSTERLEHYLHRLGISPEGLPEGFLSEINLAAVDWLAEAAGRLARGFMLTIDYGYTGNQYYNPRVRSQGTLQCYYRHRLNDNPYLHIGQQDLTAHVDFTALQQQGEAVGLETIGFTRQNFFLWALGLGERIAAMGRPDGIADVSQLEDVLRRRDALRLLVEPGGLGDFGVLIQGKGMSVSKTRLRGLSQPS